MSEQFHASPADNSGAHLVLREIAAESWVRPNLGFGILQFQKRTRSGTFATYATIPNVPAGFVGRATVVWILAHPWRIASAVRMVHAYALLRLDPRTHR